MRDDFKTIYGYSVVKTDFDFVTTNVSISLAVLLKKSSVRMREKHLQFLKKMVLILFL